jgi:hypothetical protein
MNSGQRGQSETRAPTSHFPRSLSCTSSISWLPNFLLQSVFFLATHHFPWSSHCTPASGVVPTAQEVAPWVAVIERLWDDPAFEAEHRRRALAEARRWDSETLAKQYEECFFRDARAASTHQASKAYDHHSHRNR